MSETLAHFSRTPGLDFRSDVTYERPRPRLDKPAGFWVSVEGNGDGWSDWCRSEQFGVDSLANEHVVTLKPDARILRIESAAGIDAFTDQYGIAADRGHVYGIDWAAVAAEYQGIIITPYQWSRRLRPGSSWYYGWDCASGCIWDLSAVASVEGVGGLVDAGVAAKVEG